MKDSLSYLDNLLIYYRNTNEKGAIYYVTTTTVISSRVKITCFIIQQIVTLSKYGHDALDIRHP